MGSRSAQVPGGRARAGGQALHQRHGGARHAARRRPVLRPPPGARAADRHVGRVGGAGRRGGRHRSRRAGAERAGRHPSGLAAVHRGGRHHPIRRGHPGRRRGGDRRTARAAAELIEVEYEVLHPITDPIRCHAGGRPAAASRDRDGRRQRARAAPSEARRRRRRAGRLGARRPRDVHAPSSSSTPSWSPSPRWRSPGRTAGCTCIRRGRGCGTTGTRSPRSSAFPRTGSRVTQVSNGGAFGAKEDLSVQCHAALLATRTGRPVRVTLSREESLRFHVEAPPAHHGVPGGMRRRRTAHRR